MYFLKTLAKFDNQMHKLSFSNFNSTEFNIFFSLCAALKEKGTDEITLSFEQLKQISDYKPTANNRFVEDLRRTNKKLMSQQFSLESENKIVDFVLFTAFEIDLNTNTMIVAVNRRFEFLLNQLTGNFTIVELEEFTLLKSSYSKNMYRLLKQWKSVGKKRWAIDEFRSLLDVPKSYGIGNNRFNDSVLKPISKELSQFFKGLQIEKIKQGRGGKVVALEFTWQAETRADRRKKSFQKKIRQETLPDWAEAETPPKPTLIALEDYNKLAEQMNRLGQSIEPYQLIKERYETELKEWLRTWAKQD